MSGVVSTAKSGDDGRRTTPSGVSTAKTTRSVAQWSGLARAAALVAAAGRVLRGGLRASGR